MSPWLVFAWVAIGIGIWVLANNSDDMIKPWGPLILAVGWPLLAMLCVVAIALTPAVYAFESWMDRLDERGKRGK